MAITITKDNKTIVLRNLEEQVLKNKEDIARHYEVDRVIADWGIKILGVVPSVENIPVANYEYGDAFGLTSTSPMQYVVWTRANANVGEATDYWLNIGALSLVGPQGPQGIQGNPGSTGKRGSLWTATSGGPNVVGANFLNGDLWLNAANGDVYQYIADDQRWSLKGNIRGPQGVQGPVGPKGDIGLTGPVGPQGPKGDTGSSFSIGGLLESVDNLPIPTEANRSVGYAIKNSDGVTYDLYVVVGTDNLQWVNMGQVQSVEGPQGPVGPQGPAGADIQIVYITGIPSTATQGTLTQSQVNTLLAHPSNYIQFFNENFYPQDVETSEGYIVYSHVGSIDGETKIKTINLTIATGGWVLTETPVSSRAITITNTLPEPNEENFEKGKIYTQGDVLQYIAKIRSEGNLSSTFSLPVKGRNSCAAAVGKYVYIFGCEGNGTAIYKLNTTTNTISTLSVSLPSAKYNAAAASVGNNIYIFGGATATTTSATGTTTIYKLNTTTNTISTLSVSLAKSLVYLNAVAIGNDIYILNGQGTRGASSTKNTAIYKLDTTTDTITTLSLSFNYTVGQTKAVAIGNDIYVLMAGSSATGIYKINIISSTLTSLGDTPSGGYSIANVGNYIYVYGGGNSSNSIYRFNIENNTSETLGTTPDSCYLSSAIYCNNSIYVIGCGSSKMSIYNYSFGFTYQYKTITAE